MELPTKLASVATARLPEKYVAAKNALAECSKIDECREWANKSQALASYAKQSGDESLFKLATKIKARAIRRCGELYKEIEPSKGGDASLFNAKGDTSPSVRTRTQAARDVGMSDDQRKQAQRVASVPEELFEKLVESDEPPSVTELAEVGTEHYERSKESYHPAFTDAIYLNGALGRLEEKCRVLSQRDAVEAIAGHSIPKIITRIDWVCAWLGKYRVELLKKGNENVLNQDARRGDPGKADGDGRPTGGSGKGNAGDRRASRS